MKTKVQNKCDKNLCDSLTTKFENCDQFGQAVKIGVDQGKEMKKSKLGACCSILLQIILLTYAGYKFSILRGRKNIDIVQAVKENHFDDQYVFGADQGFNIAIAIFNPWRESTFEPIDPQYGKIVFSKFEWGIDEHGQFYNHQQELETHICSSDELGLSQQNHEHGFWPIGKQFKKIFTDKIQNLFLCVDQKELEVSGNMGSENAKSFMIDVVKCQGDNCKSDEEIKQYFLNRAAYVLSNQIRFDFQYYGAQSIIKESILHVENFGDWSSILSFDITKTELALQDLAFNLDSDSDISLKLCMM